MILAFILIYFFEISAHCFAADEGKFLMPEVQVHSNITKSSQGFIQTSPSYIKKSNKKNSIGNGESLQDFIYNEPNIDVIGGPRSLNQTPQIRGLGSERTLILDEGVRQNFQSAHNGRVFSDFNLMREVEVIKGPWSSLYGSGAMGGVINYRRVQATDYEEIKNFGSELNTSYSSAANSFSQTAILYSNSAKVKPLIAVRHLNSADTRLGSGRELPYSQTDLMEYLGSFEYFMGKRQKLTLKTIMHQNEAVTPINPTIDSADLNEIANHKYDKEDILLDYKYTGKRWSLTAKPYYRKTKILNSRLSDNRQDLRSVETLGADAWLNWTTDIHTNLSLSTIFGGEYFLDKNLGTRNGVQLLSFPNGESEYRSIYLQQTYFFGERFEISPGLRYDAFENTSADTTVDKNQGEELTARIQTSYTFLKNSKLFFSFGQSFNAPRVQDIYVSDLHFPSPRPFLPDNFFVPNPNLRPETSNNFEVGYTDSLLNNKLNYSITAFHTDASQFIARDIDVANGTTTFENEDRVELSGFEVSTEYKWSKKLNFSLNYGQTRSRILTTGSTLPTTLPDKWSFNIKYRLNNRIKFNAVSVFFERQDRVPDTIEETGAFFLQNLFISYNPNKDLTFRLTANNIFDRSYVQHGNVIEGTGRDIQLLAKYIF